MKNQTKKKKKKHVFLFIILAIIAFFILKGLLKPKDPFAGYITTTAEKGNIEVYHSFTGDIKAKNTSEVMPEVSGLEIEKMLVKKGDTVKKGDVLMTLDQTSIERNIEDLEIQMDQASKANALSMKEANAVYNNYVNGIKTSHNGELNRASQNVEAALENYVIAKRDYDTEVSLNNKGLSSSLIRSTSDIDAAYNSLLAAQADYNVVYNKDYTGYGQDYMNQEKTRAMASRENAEINYQMAIKNYEAAKINEDITLTRLYDKVIMAEEAYYHSVNDYETTKLQVLQQVDTYNLNIQKTQLSSDQTANEVKLARLYEDLDTCKIYATRDGEITALNVSEGDIIAKDKAVCTITDYGTMETEIKINEYDVNETKVGTKVEVYVDALKKSYEGEIKYIDRNATITNGIAYFNADIDFDGDEDVRAGMSAEVRIYLKKVDDVLVIPNNAIQIDGDGSSFVYVKKDEKSVPEKKTITAGASDGINSEILSGINEGDIITYEKPKKNSFSDSDGDSESRSNRSGSSDNSESSESSEATE